MVVIALSYPPPFLLMILHEEMRLNPNHNPNPNLKGVQKCNSTKTMFTSRVTIVKMQNMPLFVFSADNSKQLVTAWVKHLSATERSS